jgi:hypothetical protein
MSKSKERLCLDQIIEAAKQSNTYPGVEWDAMSWDITDYGLPLAHEKSRKILYFTAIRDDRSTRHVPFEQPYADFAKSVVRMRASARGLSAHGQAHIMIGLRHLYEIYRRDRKTDPTQLTRKQFQDAVDLAKARTKGWTPFHVGKTLQEIAEWLDKHKIVRTRINFKNPIPLPRRSDALDPESQAKGLQKMPSPSALEALADITNNPLDDNERILLRIIDLLAIGGFRIGEALRLPLECWVEEPAVDRNGKLKLNPGTEETVMRCGIRYWPEKGGEPIVKWLPDIAVPLAKRAVDDLTRLCAEARAVAAVIEQDPSRIPLAPRLKEDEIIDLGQLGEILELNDRRSARQLVRRLGVMPIGTRPKVYLGCPTQLYRIGDIEKGLTQRLGSLEVIRKPGGKVQMLSQSLCVMFRNQFAAKMATFHCLPELIGVTQITTALGAKNDIRSIFSRRGLTEADGSPMRIRTHAFRHWLNTLLAHGGLSDLELARWSGRRDEKQNAAYKHGTVEQRVAWAREMIMNGSLQGPVADTYHAIDDPVEKESFLTTFVGVAHFTPYGVCLHDYSIEPCSYHLNCLSGCSEYLRTRGDKDEAANIESLLNFHLVQLTRSTEAADSGTRGANNYVRHNQRMVDGAKAALAIDGMGLHDRSLVKVFPEGKVLGKPL